MVAARIKALRAAVFDRLEKEGDVGITKKGVRLLEKQDRHNKLRKLLNGKVAAIQQQDRVLTSEECRDIARLDERLSAIETDVERSLGQSVDKKQIDITKLSEEELKSLLGE